MRNQKISNGNGRLPLLTKHILDVFNFHVNIIINADEYEPLNTFLGSCQPVIVLVVTIFII